MSTQTTSAPANPGTSPRVSTRASTRASRRLDETARVQRPEKLTALGAPDPLVALIIVAFVGGLLLRAPLIIAVTGFILTIIVAARLWSTVALRDVFVTRTFSPTRSFPHDVFWMELVIDNAKPIPVPWLRIRFTLPDGISLLDEQDRPRSAFSDVFAVAGHERIRLRRRMVASRRGRFRLSPVYLESGDLFGLFSAAGHSPPPFGELYILPTLFPAPRFRFDAEAQVGLAAEPWGRPDLSRPNGLREYRPGDPLRTIDWKASARQLSHPTDVMYGDQRASGGLVRRTFDASAHPEIVVVLDITTSELLWRFRPERLEAAISATASVIEQATSAGHPVRLVTNGLPRNYRSMGAPSGTEGRVMPEQAGGLFDRLAQVQPLPTEDLSRVIADWAQLSFDRGGATTRFFYVAARISPETLDALVQATRLSAPASPLAQQRIQCILVGDEEADLVRAQQSGVTVYHLPDAFLASDPGARRPDPNGPSTPDSAPHRSDLVA